MSQEQKAKIDIHLTSGHGGRVRYEDWLNGWFMRSLANGELKDLLGDYREFLNLVPTTLNKVMGIFLTHVITVESIDILHKYTCIELKADRATEEDLAQMLKYQDWLDRKLGSGDNEMIQSVLVARRFSDGVVDYVKNRQLIEERAIRLIAYQVTEDKQGITLQDESILP
jgi:hypothetical protein